MNSLDLRVGVIRTAVKHETADKLYCEEIDVGEAEPRAIASGLVPHYTLDEMQERRCIVVCNLKPRKLVGFKSHGMVLCASNVGADGAKEKVEFLDPPAGARPGDRIVGEGLEVVAPLTPNRCDKTKTFEAVGEGLRVDAAGVGYWKDHRLICIREGGAGSGESSGEGSEGGSAAETAAEPSIIGACTAPTVRDGPVR